VWSEHQKFYNVVDVYIRKDDCKAMMIVKRSGEGEGAIRAPLLKYKSREG